MYCHYHYYAIINIIIVLIFDLIHCNWFLMWGIRYQKIEILVSYCQALIDTLKEEILMGTRPNYLPGTFQDKRSNFTNSPFFSGVWESGITLIHLGVHVLGILLLYHMHMHTPLCCPFMAYSMLCRVLAYLSNAPIFWYIDDLIDLMLHVGVWVTKI